jgi:hypothetical protein
MRHGPEQWRIQFGVPMLDRQAANRYNVSTEGYLSQGAYRCFTRAFAHIAAGPVG